MRGYDNDESTTPSPTSSSSSSSSGSIGSLWQKTSSTPPSLPPQTWKTPTTTTSTPSSKRFTTPATVGMTPLSEDVVLASVDAQESGYLGDNNMPPSPEYMMQHHHASPSVVLFREVPAGNASSGSIERVALTRSGSTPEPSGRPLRGTKRQQKLRHMYQEQARMITPDASFESAGSFGMVERRRSAKRYHTRSGMGGSVSSSNSRRSSRKHMTDATVSSSSGASSPVSSDSDRSSPPPYLYAFHPNNYQYEPASSIPTTPSKRPDGSFKWSRMKTTNGLLKYAFGCVCLVTLLTMVYTNQTMASHSSTVDATPMQPPPGYRQIGDGPSEAGLRGQIVQGRRHHAPALDKLLDSKTKMVETKKPEKPKATPKPSSHHSSSHKPSTHDKKKPTPKPSSHHHRHDTKKDHDKHKKTTSPPKEPLPSTAVLGELYSYRRSVAKPTEPLTAAPVSVPTLDEAWYHFPSSDEDDKERQESIAPRLFSATDDQLPTHGSVELYPADFTDNTQYYGTLDSEDERLSHMELRDPYETDECEPMQDWQVTYHPSCNGMHEIALEDMGSPTFEDDVHLFGTKGYWRNAWRLDMLGGKQAVDDREPIVLKTLKYEHRFEDAHFEHDRIDAVAMERLTSSPHVINVFGFCGHSVLTEYADGKRVGELADKSKKVPLARLKIARDIANGLADVHSIDGEDQPTSFVHLDINPANVVSIGGTLKLNDFNIGILLQRNKTSGETCGFPAQYPNPQWRSPEEARNEQHLTEKVDVFSMGHIFFRLICGHEPWNKLEPNGKPAKEDINKKVQKGVLPFIPQEVLEETKDKEVVAIREVMMDCYTVDPKERPSARTIADKLQSVLDTLTSEA